MLVFLSMHQNVLLKSTGLYYEALFEPCITHNYCDEVFQSIFTIESFLQIKKILTNALKVCMINSTGFQTHSVCQKSCLYIHKFQDIFWLVLILDWKRRKLKIKMDRISVDEESLEQESSINLIDFLLFVLIFCFISFSAFCFILVIFYYI